MTNRAQPAAPAPTRLIKTAVGRYPAYRTADGRFTVTRNHPSRGVTYEDSGLDVVDTAGRNILGHATTNTVRVYEVDDAAAVIDRVRRVEYLADVQRWHDAEQRAAGLPTTVEAAQARMRDERANLPIVRAES